MKVLVIGAQGQLARSLLEFAKSADISVVAVGRPELDLLKPTTVARAIEDAASDVVINTAAYTAVDKAEAEPELAYAINAEGAGRVAEACARKNIPLIHISTDYVFNGALARPYREDDQAAPLGVYGQSKLEGERRVADVWQRHIILRTAWVYSPFGHNFVKSMLRLAANRSEIGVVDDQVGNPTYAPHLAAGILAVARQIMSWSRGRPSVGSLSYGRRRARRLGSVSRRRFLLSRSRLAGPWRTRAQFARLNIPRRQSGLRTLGSTVRNARAFSAYAFRSGQSASPNAFGGSSDETQSTTIAVGPQ